jgi:hypothetical protein
MAHPLSPLLLLLLVSAGQQPPSAPLTFETLTATVPAAGAIDTGGVREVTVNWNAYAAPPGELAPRNARVPLNRFEVIRQQVVAGPLPRDRNPELSADQIVVVGADANGTAVSWQLMKDPRVVRAEQPGADGVLTGQTLHRGSIRFTLTLPDLPQLAQVRVYEPQWTGTGWALELLASFAAGAR